MVSGLLAEFGTLGAVLVFLIWEFISFKKWKNIHTACHTRLEEQILEIETDLKADIKELQSITKLLYLIKGHLGISEDID